MKYQEKNYTKLVVLSKIRYMRFYWKTIGDLFKPGGTNVRNNQTNDQQD